jgi:hypothetical protein
MPEQWVQAPRNIHFHPRRLYKRLAALLYVLEFYTGTQKNQELEEFAMQMGRGGDGLSATSTSTLSITTTTNTISSMSSGNSTLEGGGGS